MDLGCEQSAESGSTEAEVPLSTYAKFRVAGRRLLYERPIAVLLFLLLAAVATITWHIDRQRAALVDVQALQSAEWMAKALAEFRTVYTSEVVERVRHQGITVTHDYQNRKGAIPLPATLSIILGNRIGARETGAQTRLYSAYPFPGPRANAGLTDDFAKDAWRVLTNKSDIPFYRFEELGGIPVLRYATADIMRSVCVDCHNTHPSSPKTDWKIGDVRGVLEVIAPLAIPLTESYSGLMDTAVLMLLMALGGLLIIAFILGNLRQVATEAQDLTKQTQEANRGLEREVTERKHAEAALQASENALQGRVIDLEKARCELEKQGKSLSDLTEELLIARDEARAADRAKSTFLASMSHELRIPLSAINGFSELILDEAFGPVGNAKYREYAIDIHDSGLHLLSLINDILDLSKIESGREELKEDLIDIPAMALATQKLVEQRALEGGVKLKLELPRHLPVLRADERKLKQILVNLLANAIKFTEPGGEVTLEVWCRKDTGYVLQIVDTGVGLLPEDIPRALSRFGQVDGNIARPHEGTGLGLPLTKALVEQHGGTLDLQSQIGVGTTVTVRFPAGRIVASRVDAASLA